MQPKKPWWRGFFGWVLFIALAIVLFMLLNKTENRHTLIPLSEFESRLTEDKIRHVVIDGDDLVGQFRNPETIPHITGNVVYFRVLIPKGMGSNWGFIDWVLTNRHNAVVEVERGSDWVDILAPLIPWLLIFGFLWFFVFRQLRKQQKQQPQPVPVYIAPTPPEVIPPTTPGGPQT